MKSAKTDIALAWLLRLIGTSLLLALPAVFLPHPVMDTIHRDALQLGPLPDAVIVQYLTRTASLLYAMHGLIMVYVSLDVPRYRPLIVVLGLSNGIFGASAFCVDMIFGMPRWWAAWEGPLIIAGAIATILLAKQGASTCAESTQVS